MAATIRDSVGVWKLLHGEGVLAEERERRSRERNLIGVAWPEGAREVR